MMTLAMDASQMPERALRLPAIARRAALAIGAAAGLAGLSAGAYWMMSGLAGPPPRQVRIASVASEWPDLKDGLPALASAAGPAKLSRVEPAAASVGIPKVQAAAPARPMPAIESAAVVAPSRITAIVTPAKGAALIAPLAGESVRARAANTTFAVLPPAPSAKPKTTIASRAKAAPQAQTAEAVAPEPEPDQTEILGVKVPSLAPAGRKIAEGVEALGNVVRGLPSAF